jgi:hypothetical protein
MRGFLYATFLGGLVLFSSGCGAAVSKQDLGQVTYEIPPVPEGVVLFKLPKETPPKDAGKAAASKTPSFFDEPHRPVPGIE